jgi:curli biogenesis system outer membrane secretion channel CsgG
MVRPARPLPDDAIPPVIAVTSFDNLSNYVGQWKLGYGMADVLVSELILSKNFTVVERADIGSLADELDRQTMPHFRPEGKVDQGRLKNAQYLIRGSINDFSQVGGSSFWIALRKFAFMGKGYKARVALTLTIVDVESGVVIGSVQSTGLARAGEAYVKAKYKDVRFGGDAFFKTPLGVATANAIRKGIKGLIKAVPQTYWKPMIAQVTSKGAVIINGGTNRGVRIGDVYVVRGHGRKITDPATGDVISVIPGADLGSIEITTVHANIAYARPLSGNNFMRGHLLTPNKNRQKRR